MEDRVQPKFPPDANNKVTVLILYLSVMKVWLLNTDTPEFIPCAIQLAVS